MRSPSAVTFHNCAILWLSDRAFPEFREAEDTAHFGTQRTVVWDALGGRGGMDENNSRGEGSDPSPHRVLA